MDCLKSPYTISNENISCTVQKISMFRQLDASIDLYFFQREGPRFNESTLFHFTICFFGTIHRSMFVLTSINIPHAYVLGRLYLYGCNMPN